MVFCVKNCCTAVGLAEYADSNVDWAKLRVPSVLKVTPSWPSDWIVPVPRKLLVIASESSESKVMAVGSAVSTAAVLVAVL